MWDRNQRCDPDVRVVRQEPGQWEHEARTRTRAGVVGTRPSALQVNRLDELRQFVEQGSLGAGSNEAFLLDTILKEDEGWDAHDIVLHGDLRILVDVELGNLDRVVLCGDLIKDGSHHPTGAAPFGPEVDQNRLIAVHDSGERGICCRDGLLRHYGRPDGLHLLDIQVPAGSTCETGTSFLLCEPTLCIDGGHAPAARGGNRLAVRVIGHIAGRKHTLDGGHRARARIHNVANVVEF